MEKKFEGLKKVLLNKIYSMKKEKELKTEQRTSWCGLHPWLMLYTVMTHDTVRVQYLASERRGNRLEIDARNSIQKPPDWSVTAAELYNDQNFEPTTRVLKGLHETKFLKQHRKS